MTDWTSIRADYVSGGGSFRVLAEKYGVSIDTIKKRAASEKWSLERTKVAPKLHQKTVRKVVERVADEKADRITRILSLGDALLEKAQRGIAELGEVYTVKRKETRVETDETGKPVAVDETTEIAVPGKSIVSSVAVKQLASAIKDLRDVALTGKTDQAAMDKVDKLLEEITHAAAEP